jgi:hypothetical protein
MLSKMRKYFNRFTNGGGGGIVVGLGIWVTQGGINRPIPITEGESIGESVAVVPASSEVVAGADIDDLVGDMFPKVREGVAVRTVLRYEDLVRMSKFLVWYARNNPDDNDVAWARELLKRVLRKGGSERYARRK